MLLYSIINGVTWSGAFLTVMVLGVLLFHHDAAGSPWRAFTGYRGLDWAMITLTAIALLTSVGGLIGIIVLGYQAIDELVVLAAALVTLVVTTVIVSVIGSINQKKARKPIMRRKTRSLTPPKRRG